MSKTELKQNLKYEIKRVNKIIDHKILRGMPYTREASYHKALLMKLSKVRMSGFFTRSLQSLRFTSSFRFF